jgi:uncharacterized membrane protein
MTGRRNTVPTENYYRTFRIAFSTYTKQENIMRIRQRSRNKRIIAANALCAKGVAVAAGTPDGVCGASKKGVWVIWDLLIALV